MNLSRDYYVADTQENGCSSTESSCWNFCITQPFFTFTDTTHIYKMYFCVRHRKTFIYSLVQLLCILISRAASKPYLVAPTWNHYWPLCKGNEGNLFSNPVWPQQYQLSATVWWVQLHSNLYPNLIYSHRCSARNCNNSTTNSPKYKFDSLLAVYSSDLVLNQNGL